MDSSGKKKLWIFAGVAVVILAAIGLILFSQSPSPTPTQPAPPQNISSESSPQASSADAKPSEKPSQEQTEKPGTAVDDEEESTGPDVFGVILDEKRKLVSGAQVQAIKDKIGVKRYDASATSGEDGRYDLSGLQKNIPFPYKIVASAPGYATTSSNPFLFDEAPKEINIKLTRGAVLSGRVTTAFGEGIEGANISLTESSRVGIYLMPFYLGADGVSSATTDISGDYSFPNLPPGEYSLYLHAANHIDKSSTLKISPHDSDIQMDFKMEYAGEGYVAGVVVDEDESPIQGAIVKLSQGSLGENRWGVSRACATLRPTAHSFWRDFMVIWKNPYWEFERKATMVYIIHWIKFIISI